MKNKPELLLPAKDIECLKAAINFGADAVYFAGHMLGLRAGANNFSVEEIREAIEYAHSRGRKMYMTVNIIAGNADIEAAVGYLEYLSDIDIDAFLVADPGMYRIVKKVLPNANIHISTQAGNSNYETFLFWYELGIRRVVCERLMTLSEIKDLRDNIPDDLEIECFVHGAMCISYSGRCLLSATMTGRDANHGECTHPCRWKYHLVEEARPEDYYEIEEDAKGTYIMNSKDLCMIDKLDDLLDAGVDCLKIEGRMKSPLYVATMARTYRQALDECFDDREKYKKNIKDYYEKVSAVTHRPYGHGFYYGDEGGDAIVSDNSNYVVEYTYLGYVEEIKDDYILIHQKNKFSIGEKIDIIKPEGDIIDVEVLEIRTLDGTIRESAPHPKEALLVKLSQKAEVFDLIRRNV